MCTRDEAWSRHQIKHDCNGRVVSTGESDWQRYTCIGLQLFGSALFYAFPARYLLEEQDSVVALVLGALLNAISLYCFLKASFTDPGIVPAAEQPPYLVAEWRPPRTVNVVTSRGRSVLKFCDACNVYKPYLAEHCPICNNCILRYDHHCPWLGNCVGQRNYPYFYSFIVTISLYSLIAIAASISTIVLSTRANGGGVDSFTGGSIALLVFTPFWATMTLSLLFVHSYLLATGQTTYEWMRPVARSDKKRIQLEAALRSCFILCHPLTESLFRERQQHQDGTLARFSSKEVSPKDFGNFAIQMFGPSHGVEGSTPTVNAKSEKEQDGATDKAMATSSEPGMVVVLSNEDGTNATEKSPETSESEGGKPTALASSAPVVGSALPNAHASLTLT